MSMHPQVRFTYDDYKSLTEFGDQRYELIDGDLYMNPSPSATHQAILTNLLFVLETHVRATRCGRVLCAPLDVVLGRGEQRSVVQPDLLFILADNERIVGIDVVGAPDLVVEILSRSTSTRDRQLKKSLYARHGVREYWIVDPEAKGIDVYVLEQSGYEAPSRYMEIDELTSVVVPGLSFVVESIFINLP